MKKLSAEQVQLVLSQVPETLRKLAAERDFWKKEAQARMQREEAEKVAHAMHEKGISLDVPIKDLVDQLEKAAASGRLEKIAEAVDLVGPNMGQKIAHLTSDEGHTSGGPSEFERFILGGIG
jgi:hypothetical protein